MADIPKLSAAPAAERESAAEVFAARLDRPMGVLGIIFLFVVLGQLLATDPTLSSVLAVLGWIFWTIFVGEFLLRAYIAGFSKAFWKRSWWQVIFLLVPFLRFFRALQALRFLRVARVARFGGVLSAGVRGSRSAGRLLSSRIGWLIAVTAVVVLVSSQLLFLSGSHDDYATALYVAAMATITGSGVGADDAFARILSVALAVYSVAVFATLAGSLGAFFLRGEQPARAAEPGDASAESDPAFPAR
ncbi:ion transporter [Planctomonas psychrotolerans]|uniref:ion transporter n=1 Tax=Planctomonas psychrotolerans TaxID=2528712 RepID=UPI00123C7441|nr:ion transporter [Planctomonas psychrotolerans]